MFELSNISKTYGQTTALRPLDATIETGRTTVLIGPSGCGKSTLLRILVGLIEPTTGDVRFEGVALAPSNLREARRKMGYVIQEGGLFPHLSAVGNVALLARHLGWPRDRIDARVNKLAALTKVPKEMLDRYPAQLSGGQRQRISLMRALMLDPAVLLLDEPLGALDPMIRAELQSDLRQIFRALSKTVIMVTHDLAEAAYFADEIVLMRGGAVIQRGTMSTLINEPTDPFVTEFVQAQRGLHDTIEEGDQ